LFLSNSKKSKPVQYGTSFSFFFLFFSFPFFFFFFLFLFFFFFSFLVVSVSGKFSFSHVLNDVNNRELVSCRRAIFPQSVFAKRFLLAVSPTLCGTFHRNPIHSFFLFFFFVFPVFGFLSKCKKEVRVLDFSFLFVSLLHLHLLLVASQLRRLRFLKCGWWRW